MPELIAWLRSSRSPAKFYGLTFDDGMCRGMPRPWSIVCLSMTICPIDDVQRGTLYIEHSILALSIASEPPATSLPQKLGYSEAANVDKSLKTWSGRRDSNPRVQLGKRGYVLFSVI